MEMNIIFWGTVVVGNPFPYPHDFGRPYAAAVTEKTGTKKVSTKYRLDDESR